jgi:hypothetical protein
MMADMMPNEYQDKRTKSIHSKKRMLEIGALSRSSGRVSQQMNMEVTPFSPHQETMDPERLQKMKELGIKEPRWPETTRPASNRPGSILKSPTS